MKKLLTILLALLVVTGVVFAAIDHSDAVLTIKATNEPIFQHGITKVKMTAGTQDLYSEEEGDTFLTSKGVAVDIDLSNTNSQPLGVYYSIRTNLSSDVKIGVTGTPLWLELEDSSTYYIPYTFSIGADDANKATVGGTAGVNESPMASGEVVSLKTEWDAQAGLRYFSEQISILLAQDYSVLVPATLEGGFYQATITFAISGT
jgi:hypothetical protein